MDLKSGYPWWSVRNGLMHGFRRLDSDLECDVAVVGGGITGALIAHELASHGHAVAVLEQGEIAWGSTSASTALLQYEIDTHLGDLIGQVGERNGLLAYRACVSALPMIAQLAAEIGDVDHADMDSLYLASSRWQARSVRAEFELRQRHGFDVELLEAGAVRERYGIKAPLAILNRPAGRIDPYRMAMRLLAGLERDGAAVHDRTGVVSITASQRRVELRTGEGFAVRAGDVVVATGYAAQQWLRQRVARNRSSYAVITDPVEDDSLGALADTLVWESARPYLYLRSTGDGRVLIGGEDDSIDVPARRDARVGSKSRTLLKKAAAMCPWATLVPAFAWAGTFAETSDGLPFFGAHAQYGPRVHFAMAYGGNGITYSALGAGLLRARIERRRHPLATLFGFGRL
jgi:glycine/D-amino acid oxidase-like deaminating enzyme